MKNKTLLNYCIRVHKHINEEYIELLLQEHYGKNVYGERHIEEMSERLEYLRNLIVYFSNKVELEEIRANSNNN